MPWGTRTPDCAGLGFGWVFNTDETLLKLMIYNLQQSQIENPHPQFENRVRELQFCSRYLDSWVLFLLRPLTRLQNFFRSHFLKVGDNQQAVVVSNGVFES
jgi:hypothetical protein